MRKTVLAIFVKLFFCFTASAQTNSAQTNINNTSSLIKPFSLKSDSTRARVIFLPAIVPANFYTSHLPFFCSTELKLQKALKFPVKFRLGSVEYSDRLEGKRQR